MVKDSVLYDRLNVATDATDTQIKKAFIHLSKQWHPDKHGDEMKEEASTKFKEITEAKDILIDTDKRSTYDQIGMDILRQGQGGGGGDSMANPFGGGFPFGGGGGGFNPFGGGGFNPFGGGGFNPFGGGGGQQRQLQPVMVDVKVTLEQLYKEERVSLIYTHQVDCQQCDGEGGKTDTCTDCKGNGKVVHVQRMGNIMTQSISDCRKCNGKGRQISSKCGACSGQGFSSVQKSLAFSLSSRLVSGNKVQVRGEGNRSKQSASDLIVTVNVIPHDIFKHQQSDLLTRVELTLHEALFGFNKTLALFDGSVLVLESSTKTDCNTIKCFQQKGIHKEGKLYVMYVFTLPTMKKEDYGDILKDMLPDIVVENVKSNEYNEILLSFLKM